MQTFNLGAANVSSGVISAATSAAWQTLVPNGSPASAGMIVEVSLRVWGLGLRGYPQPALLLRLGNMTEQRGIWLDIWAGARAELSARK